MTKEADVRQVMAYVDGHLPSDAENEIRRKMARDPDLDTITREMVADSLLLQRAMSTDDYASPPPHLTRRVDSLIMGRNLKPPPAEHLHRPGNDLRHFWSLTALVASLLLAVGAGYWGGHLAAPHREPIARALGEARYQADLRSIDGLVDSALERHASGDAFEWRNPDTGVRGTVTPTRTFRDDRGSWCREYTRVIETPAKTESVNAIACRSETGHWITRVYAVLDPT